MTNKLLHFSKYLKEGKLLLVALVFVMSPCAESNWLAVHNAANSGNSLKQNLGKLTDILNETVSASMEGDGARVEELWGEVKKVPADIIKNSFPVLKVGDVAAGAWAGVGKRLKTAERKINRFVGRAGKTITDARAALTTDNDEWDWYSSEAPLPKPTVTNKAAILTNNGGVAGWSKGNANNDWSDSNPMEAFRQQVLEEERQAKLEGDRLWAKELERRAQLAKEEECFGVCDEVESDDSQSDYASALAETIGESPVAAINQNSYQVELENLEAEHQAQLERERIEEERKRMARLERERIEEERKRMARLEQEKKERQRQERKRQERLAEQEQERQDRLLAQRQRELDRQYKQQILNNVAQSLNNLVDAYSNSVGGQTGTSANPNSNSYIYYDPYYDPYPDATGVR